MSNRRRIIILESRVNGATASGIEKVYRSIAEDFALMDGETDNPYESMESTDFDAFLAIIQKDAGTWTTSPNGGEQKVIRDYLDAMASE